MGSDHAFADHDCWGIAWAFPTGFSTSWLTGKTKVVEVFAQEFIVKLGKKFTGRCIVDGDDFFDELLMAQRGRGGFWERFTA